MQPNTLSGKARNNLVKILNHALEDEGVLSVTMRGFLTNITGPNFHSLNRLFGDQCRQIDRWLREISDRVRGFGVVAEAGATEVARSAQEALEPKAALLPRNMIGELLAQHQGIADRLRADFTACTSDPATAELLKGLIEFHETAAWMLRMVLDGPEVPRPRD